MTSQGQCIRQNIGAWHGSFTQFSPDGGVVLNKSEYEAHSGRFVQELSLSNNPLPESEISQKLIFFEGDLTYQLMALPNGAYCLLPRTIEKISRFNPKWAG